MKLKLKGLSSSLPRRREWLPPTLREQLRLWSKKVERFPSNMVLIILRKSQRPSWRSRAATKALLRPSKQTIWLFRTLMMRKSKKIQFVVSCLKAITGRTVSQKLFGSAKRFLRRGAREVALLSFRLIQLLSSLQTFSQWKLAKSILSVSLSSTWKPAPSMIESGTMRRFVRTGKSRSELPRIPARWRLLSTNWTPVWVYLPLYA